MTITNSERAIHWIRSLRQIDVEEARLVVNALRCALDQHLQASEEEKAEAVGHLDDCAIALLDALDDKRTEEQKTADARDEAKELT